MATRSTRATTKAAAPVEEPEEDEFEEMEDGDEDLEELEDAGEDEADETPAPKGKKTAGTKAAAPKKDTIQFGSPWLAQYVTEQTGETYDGRAVRMLLRKLAKDGKLDREVGVERARYEFTGPNDPTVKAVVAMVKSGEAKAMRQAGLQAVKDKAAEKKAAAKAAKEAVEAEEMEDAEEVEEEAPKPRRTRTAAAKPAPTKATPAKATASRRRASTTSA